MLSFAWTSRSLRFLSHLNAMKRGFDIVVWERYVEHLGISLYLSEVWVVGNH